MFDEIAKRVVGPLFATISGYFNLPAYGKIKWAEMRHGMHSYFREEDYWRDAIGEYFHEPGRQVLKEGDVVRLQQFEVSEWFPRAPGSFWTKRGFERRRNARTEIEHETPSFLVFSPKGKRWMMEGGVGTMRLELRIAGQVKYRILGATSSGNCNCGIPLVVTEDVYDRIASDLLTERSLCATVEGKHTLVPISREEMILSAAGVQVPLEIAEWVPTSFYVPRSCVLVESILLVKDIRPGLGLRAAAWSVYQCRDEEYGWTYRTFDPREENSLKEAVEFLNEYAWGHRGEKFLTEFDEHIKRLNAEWDIDKVFAGTASPRSHSESIFAWGNNLTP